MAFSTISDEYITKIDSFPCLQGFGAPQQGCLMGNLSSDKKIYTSLAEVQRAALKNPECAGFTSLPNGGWRLRVGRQVWNSKKSIQNMDVSFLKLAYHPRQTDDL